MHCERTPFRLGKRSANTQLNAGEQVRLHRRPSNIHLIKRKIKREIFAQGLDAHNKGRGKQDRLAVFDYERFANQLIFKRRSNRRTPCKKCTPPASAHNVQPTREVAHQLFMSWTPTFRRIVLCSSATFEFNLHDGHCGRCELVSSNPSSHLLVGKLIS